MQVPTRTDRARHQSVPPPVSPSELAALTAAAGLTGAAVQIRRLDGGFRVALEAAAMYPASMIKTPLAIAAGAAVAAGRLAFDDAVTVDPANMTVNDAPSPLQPGYVATVAELVALMIERSDNVATNLLIDRLGRAQATADIAALGFPQTAFHRKVSGADPLVDDPAATGRNAHPAAEAATLFERIADGRLPAAGIVYRSLQRQVWNTKLSAGLEPGDRFAHKTGDTDATSHDGGILDLREGGRFAIVVYTDRPSNDETDARFVAFMRALRPRLIA